MNKYSLMFLFDTWNLSGEYINHENFEQRYRYLQSWAHAANSKNN